MYCEINYSEAQATDSGWLMHISGASNENALLFLSHLDQKFECYARDAGASDTVELGAASSPNTWYQLTASISDLDNAASQDGAAIVEQAANIHATPTDLLFGSNADSAFKMTGQMKIRKAIVVPRVVSDADLPNWRYR
jgi:hypothetical protein